jgi:hypothetical protein
MFYWWAAKLAFKNLTGSAIASRNLEIFPDDVFLVSYARSGSTWMRFLVGNLVHPNDPVTFASLEKKMPEIYLNTKKALDNHPRPRILTSHEPFDPRYKKLIYIVRDPRDVALSYYHLQVKLRRFEEEYTIGQFLPRFFAGEFDTAGSWGENVGSWLVARGNTSGFLFLRYEDVLTNTVQELSKIASFLGVNADPERVERAVELSSADRMRSLEKKEPEGWKLLRGSRNDKSFVRLAASGGGLRELPESAITAIESEWGPIMQELGYPLHTARTAASPVFRDQVQSIAEQPGHRDSLRLTTPISLTGTDR